MRAIGLLAVAIISVFWNCLLASGYAQVPKDCAYSYIESMEMTLQMTSTWPLKFVSGICNNAMLSPRGYKVERKWRCKVREIRYWIKTRTTTFLLGP